MLCIVVFSVALTRIDTISLSVSWNGRPDFVPNTQTKSLPQALKLDCSRCHLVMFLRGGNPDGKGAATDQPKKPSFVPLTNEDYGLDRPPAWVSQQKNQEQNVFEPGTPVMRSPTPNMRNPDEESENLRRSPRLAARQAAKKQDEEWQSHTESRSEKRSSGRTVDPTGGTGRLSWRESSNIGVRMRMMRGEDIFEDDDDPPIPLLPKESPRQRVDMLRDALHAQPMSPRGVSQPGTPVTPRTPRAHRPLSVPDTPATPRTPADANANANGPWPSSYPQASAHEPRFDVPSWLQDSQASDDAPAALHREQRARELTELLGAFPPLPVRPQRAQA